SSAPRARSPRLVRFGNGGSWQDRPSEPSARVRVEVPPSGRGWSQNRPQRAWPFLPVSHSLTHVNGSGSAALETERVRRRERGGERILCEAWRERPGG